MVDGSAGILEYFMLHMGLYVDLEYEGFDRNAQNT